MMKHMTRALRTALAIMALSGSAAVVAAPETYEVDPTHTVVGFLVDHVGFSRVLGRFDDVAGSFRYDPNTRVLEQLEIVVQTDSVESGNAARDKHVRGGDFLDVRKHPTMTFTIDSATLASADGGTVEGMLTLLGVSRPVTLDIEINRGAVYPFGHKRFTFGASARGAFNRSEFNMSYGVGNALVGDEVELIIEVEAPTKK